MLAHERVEDGVEAQVVSASDVELIAASANGANGDIDLDSSTLQFNPPLIPSHEDSLVPFSALGQVLHEKAVKRNGLAVIVPPAQNRWEYKVFREDDKVDEILEEYDDAGCVEYLVLFSDGSEDVISFGALRKLENGPTLIADFGYQSTRDSDLAESALSSDDELSMARPSKPKARGRRQNKGSKTTLSSRTSRQRKSQSQLSLVSVSSQSEGDEYVGKEKRRPAARVRGERATRAAAQKRVNYSDMPALEDMLEDESDDDLVQLGKRKRSSSSRSGPGKTRKLLRGPRRPESDMVEVSRRSGRNTGRTRDMREIGEEDIPETATANNVARYAVAKEAFKELSPDDDFRLRHFQTCDICREEDDDEVKGMLVFCQGCTSAFHQKCLGPRTGREHLVTKIGPKDFVLQCRRCVGIARNKDALAPDQGLCLSCHEPGSSTTAFRERKTAKDEQKEREDNGGEDPTTDVLTELLNNSMHVLFRCTKCYRACHMHHLPPRDQGFRDIEEEDVAEARFDEYSQDWQCKDCLDAPGEVETLVAWRPTNMDRYEPGQTTDGMEEDAKEYLVKWKKMSYFKVQWMPGAWVWGVAASATLKAFAKKDGMTNLPKMSTEEAVPEDYLRVDIVFDVEYTNIVNAPSEKIAKARIKEIRKAYVKFKGLGYEDAVWIESPSPEDAERWTDFKAAYEDWVMGSYTRLPAKYNLNAHLNKVRAQDFGSELAMKSQPASLTGGELMAYQMEGLNWLYYQWVKKKNAILADEMGLGKTIQVIGFLAALKQVHGCWPFLVVVPNSTCPNWRREIKQWAPSLRVVTYYGSARARKLALDHELFPEGGKDLRCHVVVTSYEAAQDTEFRTKFKGISWQGLIVDEGQRLKNDKNILYGALNALKPPFKLLLTGTPLQNNARELFNLLQFLDSSIDAEALEEEYSTLTKENVAQLHEQLREYFLRRTKAGVLKFLPSMAQIILPVTMSIVQKKLYKSILAKNPELIKSIVGPSKRALGKTERANLNNILMQLRKCLAHPFVYSKDIEERSSNHVVSHRNLVEASSKLQLLEIMLPKLQERGHRVLIFSQFLDMLDMVEDFLAGLGLFYQRLDGNIGSLQKQKRIDEFNAPDSPLFAFLLSTRAGGVGINLATADTVIILDPDFNPHQDIQALSRAHRIGQKKKVLVFQLTTRNTAEEKIMQIGKRKMALDHVLIEQMDAEDDAGMDLESILKYGTEALFKDDDTQDIHYDSASVDRLLDRSQIEDTNAGNDDSAESQFSFARVWANDKGVLEDNLGNADAFETEVDPSIWENILKEREREAAAEAVARAEDFGRGRRKRQVSPLSTRQSSTTMESSLMALAKIL
ncbi:MAG: hypothetical protein ALECFALPRED_005254 [Alectoria fallacina]|uniref:Chromatin remodeling factor mit1 n=1 Tax=Alectoria fallacina TaxID=1903189 RepID=A0A8H3IU42_9LECA|nr:MAG: hypothetical protein ALECFALPRED_005254 [Alectoria fallacina]